MSHETRCSTCNSASVNPRNLVVFIDGTSNKPGDKNTNVVKLHDQMKEVGSSTQDEAEPEQRKMYWTGIGTHPKHLAPLDRVWREAYSCFEMSFAWNVEKNVKRAYAWLAEHYKEGSQIYLFGFSRGAYQVRVLASMIHEVGLTRYKEHIDMAYGHYVSVHPYKPQTRVDAHKFKREFCWPGVRVHFVGVWDTVSSVGLIKKDVFVSASANVINSCHFRHALALDECRVKFMPEYFGEMNGHHGNIRTPTPPVGDVKEVWFAGSHSDVGGINRPDPERVLHPEDGDHTNHAGNVALQWMRREATDQGLVFNPDMLFWDPEDVDFGRKDTMSILWRSLEFLPIRHQVSFSGPGKHGRRWHRFEPRRVIPAQQIHASVLTGDIYVTGATLGDGINIPTVSRRTSGGLWTTELVDQQATTVFLTSVLNDHRKTLESLEKVIFLLDSWLDNGQTPAIPCPQWPESSIRGKFSLAVIYSSLSASEELVIDARNSLKTILARRERQECREALFVLRFLARHETLRQRIVSPDVITAVVGALGWTADRSNQILFPLVIDSLCYLMQDDNLRDGVINGLSETQTGKTRLILALEVKAPDHLVALLKLIASLAMYLSSGRSTGPCEVLKPRIVELAEKSRGSVGVAAVEALVALNVPPRNIHFSTILTYLDNTLPLSEVEGGSSSSPADCIDLPVVLRVDGSGGLDEKIMSKLMSTAKSHDARKRTGATLSLLKLCRNPAIRKYLSDHNFVNILLKQLEQKETSLLASYALETCLRHGIHVDFPCAARAIFIVFNKGWFDDAVGRVEGFKIFRKLMMSGKLRQEVVKLGIVDVLVKKFEASDLHEVRVGLLCLDILGAEHPEFLKSLVDQSLTRLRSEREKIQNKGVKVLSALARTVIGEEAIKPHVGEIVKMLLGDSRSPLSGPAAALYGLSKNETLRDQIKGSEEFVTFKRQRRATLNGRG